MIKTAKRFSVLTLSLFALLLSGPLARAADIEEVTIIGDAEEARRITGSAHFIGPDKLKLFSYGDVERILRAVPGVSLQLEDGYGLRPNISIRGVSTERSSRVTLLEDNVLIAPAPYSAPSAYYFPTPGRMHAFEVVKGPAAITQGPYTIGGALNMVSTPIPDQSVGNVLLETGQAASHRLHATYGNRLDSGFGFLFETHQWLSDGFQSIDRSREDTGLNVQDYTVKLGYAPANSPHAVELKFQYADQSSNQSYLGLTDADFRKNPTRRYGLSALDTIDTEHMQFILRYNFALNEDLSLSATAYNNDHKRTWFKTEGIDLDGSPNAQALKRTSWSKIIRAVNTGAAVGGFSADRLQQILDGRLDTAPGSIQIRSNAREYFSRGIQLGLNWSGMTGPLQHDLEIGLRYHQDEEDRLQRNSSYRQQNGALQLSDRGVLGNAGNRVQEAEALAVHIYDTIEYGPWVLTPGLRFESIEQKRTRYRGGRNRTFRDSRENKTDVLLPGFGAIYNINARQSLLAGIHKGFTAPSNSPGVREEEALNYEFGYRFADGERLRAEIIGFWSDYDNLLGECTVSSGTDCTVGDAFNGDAATVRGVELSASANLTPDRYYSVPVSLSYTYTDARFDTDIADTDFFGDVGKGDPIPYIPEHQAQFGIGYEQSNWGVYLNARYSTEVCTRAACGAFQKTDKSLVLDFSGNVQLSESVDVFARIENLTNRQDIVARQPYGARPNKPLTAFIGVRFSF